MRFTCRRCQFCTVCTLVPLRPSCWIGGSFAVGVRLLGSRRIHANAPPVPLGASATRALQSQCLSFLSLVSFAGCTPAGPRVSSARVLPHLVQLFSGGDGCETEVSDYLNGVAAFRCLIADESNSFVAYAQATRASPLAVLPCVRAEEC
ncbi:hypothetical protein TRVL_06542 [Trypanosoma vivax]|nr:hypothetical protein TRVL_06542 [Trypanosoma vivax]